MENKSGLGQEKFGQQLSDTAALNQLDKEQIIRFMDFSRTCEIKTCPGDIYKIVNTLMDYSRLLEMVIDEWSLNGYHQAIYEVQAEQLRRIANKFASGIGYNYEKAVEKCKKRQEKKVAESDVGEDGLTLAITRRREKVKGPQEAQKAQEGSEGREKGEGKVSS